MTLTHLVGQLTLGTVSCPQKTLVSQTWRPHPRLFPLWNPCPFSTRPNLTVTSSKKSMHCNPYLDLEERDRKLERRGWEKEKKEGTKMKERQYRQYEHKSLYSRFSSLFPLIFLQRLLLETSHYPWWVDRVDKKSIPCSQMKTLRFRVVQSEGYTASKWQRRTISRCSK